MTNNRPSSSHSPPSQLACCSPFSSPAQLPLLLSAGWWRCSRGALAGCACPHPLFLPAAGTTILPGPLPPIPHGPPSSHLGPSPLLACCWWLTAATPTGAASTRHLPRAPPALQCCLHGGKGLAQQATAPGLLLLCSETAALPNLELEH